MDRRRLLILSALATLMPSMALASGKEEKKMAGGASYLPIPTLLGTTIGATGRRGTMSVDCGLDVPDTALRSRADQSLPRLRAAYVQVVQSYAAGLSPGELPNPDYIGQALQRQTDQVLGRPGARVLLGSVVVN